MIEPTATNGLPETYSLDGAVAETIQQLSRAADEVYEARRAIQRMAEAVEDNTLLNYSLQFVSLQMWHTLNDLRERELKLTKERAEPTTNRFPL